MLCDGPPHVGPEPLGECCPSGGWVRGFAQPRLLLSLLQRPSHGYELMERMEAEQGLPNTDPGLLYRTLRALEHEGLVSSRWETEGAGPARRLYEVTAEGVELLHAWAVRIRATQRQLARFLQAYEAHFGTRQEA